MKKERAPLTYGPVYLVTRFLNYSFLYLSFITTDKIVSQRVRYSQHRYLYVYLYLQQYTTLGDFTFYCYVSSHYSKVIVFDCEILHLRYNIQIVICADFVCEKSTRLLVNKSKIRNHINHMKSKYTIIMRDFAVLFIFLLRNQDDIVVMHERVYFITISS